MVCSVLYTVVVLTRWVEGGLINGEDEEVYLAPTKSGPVFNSFGSPLCFFLFISLC